jgi:hypothetical protein
VRAMYSIPSNCRLVGDITDPLDEVEYICIAADLLQQMFSGLRALAANNTRLARALSIRGSNARARLCTLHEIVGMLMGVEDRLAAAPLRRRATALISWLSDEIDELSLCAAGGESPADTFGVAVH